MSWVVYYTVLLVAFAALTAFTTVYTGHLLSTLRSIAGALPILSALGQALVKVDFRLYLFSQRIWIGLNGAKTSLWSFQLRLDGDVDSNIMEQLPLLFTHELAQWQPRYTRLSPQDAVIKIDRTIHLKVHFTPACDSEDADTHLMIASDDLEVTYASAKKKIDTSLVPLMNSLLRAIPSRSSGTSLEIRFDRNNPFFSFFVAHLRSEQVDNFNLVFHPTDLTRSPQDVVIVQKHSVAIRASSPDGFAMLAKIFLLLSKEAVALHTT